MLRLIFGRAGEILTCSFFTCFVNFDTAEWMLIEQVGDFEELTQFLQCEKLNIYFT
jgi:hypothetical protein